MEIDQYKKRVNGKPTQTHDLQVIERAGLQARSLTGTEHWDFFLSVLQPKVEETEVFLTNAKEQLADPRVVDENHMRQLKLAAVIYAERLNILREVMELPKRIIEHGDKATLHLKGIHER